MGRLIDANELLTQVRQIDFLKLPNSTKLSACEIMRIINCQPTAYDVDKVQEDIQKMHILSAAQKSRVIKAIRKGGV